MKPPHRASLVRRPAAPAWRHHQPAVTAAALVCAATIAVLVALTGFTLASGLHTMSHYTDRHLGGHGSDVPVLGLFTVVGLYAIYSRIRGMRSASQAEEVTADAVTAREPVNDRPDRPRHR